MKLNIPFLSSAFPLAIPLMLSVGCVSYTTTRNETRESVRFASPEAAQTFYDALLGTMNPPERRDTLAVYVQPPFWHYKVNAGNVHFNQAIHKADADGDGIISDQEAAAYSAQLKQPHQKKKNTG